MKVEITHHRPHILFLYSDTGGGHRSAAQAIIEAMQHDFSDLITTQMVDIFLELAPRPLSYLPKWYPYMVRIPEIWGMGYHLSNGSHRARLIVESAYPYIRRTMHRVVNQYPADMIVSVHPLANDPFLHALGKRNMGFCTVVTDLVTTHALWYHKDVDLCMVPTQDARQRALIAGLNPEQVKVVGLPVAYRFCQPPGDKNTLRKQLGWPLHRPVILVMGGGEGMGPIEKVATAIAGARLPITLVVIAGRNQGLKEQLEARDWPVKTFVYGFVSDMPDFMRAADILVTKAGPGTISEALIASLPMVLYSRLPGQEDGNISFVVSEGVGVWASEPTKIVNALRNWLGDPHQLEQAAQACRRVARPNAARDIAHLLADRLGVVNQVT